MSDPRLPLNAKVTLDAQTDQALMAAREIRASLATVDGGDLMQILARGVALHLAAQFPGQAIGRVVMAVTQSLRSMEGTLAELDGGVSFESLTLISALAAEQLDREAAQ